MRYGRNQPISSTTALSDFNLRRIAGFLTPYWPQLALVFVTVSMAAVLGVIPALLTRAIIDSAIGGGDRDLLALLAVGFAGAALASGLMGVLRSYLNTLVSQRIMHDLKLRMFTRLQSLSLRFFTEARTGEMMSRLTSDISGIDSVISGTLVTIFSNVLILATTLAAMATLDPALMLLALAVLPWLIVPTITVGRIRRRLRTERQERNAGVNSLMAETLGISGQMLIKTFGRERRVLDRFRTENRALMVLQIREALVGRWYFMLLALVTTAGPALIFWYGGGQVISGTLSLGVVVAFVALLGRLYGPATDLMSLHVDVMTSAAYFERIFEYLDLEPDIQDAQDAVELPPAQGRVRFEGVSLEYTPGRRALAEIDIDIAPGQTVALVGPSGAGKTTTTYLVPRLYDATDGRVLIDGIDVREVTLESLRRQVGYVTQETFLFHDTIRENLLLAKPDAGDDELRAACLAASVLGVIEALPNGLGTVVGERGYRLSGGEKQRLALARIFLKDPRVLLLDEATASLDSHSEREVQAALATLMAGRTTIVIAHRLSTIHAADVILYMEHGRIVESGPHGELMAAGGPYAALYAAQFASTAEPETAVGG